MFWVCYLRSNTWTHIWFAPLYVEEVDLAYLLRALPVVTGAIAHNIACNCNLLFLVTLMYLFSFSIRMLTRSGSTSQRTVCVWFVILNLCFVLCAWLLFVVHTGANRIMKHILGLCLCQYMYSNVQLKFALNNLISNLFKIHLNRFLYTFHSVQ